MYNFKKVLILSGFLSCALYANDINIDGLLNNIEVKTDLSSKTKLENSGVNFIYTRSDIDRMQARNLQDILKSAYPLGYKENRYGLPDSLSGGTSLPYTSSSIRVFIDDQELTNGLYGSGFIGFGDIDIGFVDHIEIYSGNPTYEFSTEVTFSIVKLYSKVQSKDGGSKILANYGSYNANHLSFYNSEEFGKDWAYFTYVSQNNDKRKKYNVDGTDLSRDKETTHVFSSIYNKEHHILLDAYTQKRDSFINRSCDATPEDARLDIDNLHIGYNGSHNELSYLVSYDYGQSKSHFLDDLGRVHSVEVDSKESVFNIESKYTKETSTNKFIVGLKYRIKKYDYDRFDINGLPLAIAVPTANTNNDKQTISTVFVENQYSIQENSIITTGISKSAIRNNHSNQDDDVLLYRVGFTNTNENWVYKILASHNEKVIDAYMVIGEGLYITPGIKKPQEENLAMADISYKKDNRKYEVILSKLQAKKTLISNAQGLLYNNNETINIKSVVMGYTREYNEYDKFYMTLGYSKKSNLPVIDTLTEYASTLLNINQFGKFDIFNEVLYYSNDMDHKDFFDYSLGVTYHKTEDLSISLKGTNVLDKAREIKYRRFNPTTMQEKSPLGISSIDRAATITIEYTF